MQRSISLPRIIPHSGTWQERHHSVSISVLTQSILSWKRKQVTKDHADAANGLEDKLDAAWKFPKLHRTLYNENQWNVLKRHCMIVSRIQRTSVLTLHYLESATILKSKSQVSLDTTRHPGEPPQICIGLWLLSRDPVCYKDEKVTNAFLKCGPHSELRIYWLLDLIESSEKQASCSGQLVLDQSVTQLLQ